MVDLGDGGAEAVLELRLRRAQVHALLLQRVRLREVQLAERIPTQPLLIGPASCRQRSAGPSSVARSGRSLERDQCRKVHGGPLRVRLRRRGRRLVGRGRGTQHRTAHVREVRSRRRDAGGGARARECVPGFAQTRNPSFLRVVQRGLRCARRGPPTWLGPTRTAATPSGSASPRRNASRRDGPAAPTTRSSAPATGATISAESNAVRSGLMARFREDNGELHDLIQEQADRAYGAGLRRTVALILILSAAFASMAGMLLTRLRRQERERQPADQAYHSTQREFAEILQVTESENEAHALVKRHLERSLPGSDVVVLNRNNSQNRLEATTPVNTRSAFRGSSIGRAADC